MSISLSEGGLVIPSSWCELMAENTTCTCSWANLFPVDIEANMSHGDAEKHELGLKLDSWLEGVLLPIIATIGTIGNIVSILVLTNKDIDLKPSFVNILICLAIYDLMFEILAVLVYSLEHISQSYKEHVFPFVTPYVLGLIHMTLTGSVYTTIALAVERTLTVLAPFTKIKSFNGFLYLFPIILFSILYNIPKFFEVETVCNVYYMLKDSGSPEVVWVHDQYAVARTSLRDHPKYLGYVVSNSLVMGLLPMLLLAILNWLIFRAVSSARRHHVSLMARSSSSSHRRDGTMAALLSGIVLIFVICHTPKAILNIYEVYEDLYDQAVNDSHSCNLMLVHNLMMNISHILIATNSAVNIVVYSLKDFKFRALFWSLCGGSKTSLPGAQVSAGLNCPRGSRGLEDKKMQYLDIPNGQEDVPTVSTSNCQMIELTNFASPEEEKKLLQTDL